MKIKISSVKRIVDGRIRVKDLILYVLFFTIIMETLIVQFGFPSFLRYTNDVAILLVAFSMRLRIFDVLKKIKCQFIIYAFIILCFVFFVSAFINLVPVQLVIWASRNLFRGIIFFFAIVYYLDISDLKKIFAKLYLIQILNLLLVFYQYFILHHVQDEIGGIFGYGNGAGVNTFNALLIAYYISAYLSKKEPLYKLGVIVLSSLVIAALAEEKMTYILFVIIFAYVALVTKFSFKKLGVCIIGGVGLVIGLVVLKQVYPNMYEVLTDFRHMMSYSTQTFEEGYRIPRIGAFPVIKELFFGDDMLKVLFGLGFGNCETSNFALFQSEFYETYGMWNYRLFTHQWTFLECGLVGFVSLLFFFIICIGYMFLYRNKLELDELMFLHTGLIVAICSVVTMWYNATLKVDMCYIAYFGMAIGMLAIKHRYQEHTIRKEENGDENKRNSQKNYIRDEIFFSNVH